MAPLPGINLASNGLACGASGPSLQVCVENRRPVKRRMLRNRSRRAFTVLQEVVTMRT